MFRKINKASFYYGFPVVLMTTKNNQDNITVISSTWTLGKYVILGLSINSQGFLNIQNGSDVTLNLADAQLWQNVEAIAKTTGCIDVPVYKQQAGYVFCEDKFTLGRFTKLVGETVDAVRIKECPIHIETKVKSIMVKSGFAIIECEIHNIFVNETILYDDTYIDVEKWQPLIYKFREYTTTHQSLGVNFRFEEYKSSF